MAGRLRASMLISTVNGSALSSTRRMFPLMRSSCPGDTCSDPVEGAPHAPRPARGADGVSGAGRTGGVGRARAFAADAAAAAEAAGWLGGFLGHHGC